MSLILFLNSETVLLHLTKVGSLFQIKDSINQQYVFFHKSTKCYHLQNLKSLTFQQKLKYY